MVSALSPPEAPEGAVSVEQACAQEVPNTEGRRGRVGQLVEIPTMLGPVTGYLSATRPAAGLLIAFSGLGAPAWGWINERFAEEGARRGLVTFALIRNESARPMFFDPLREALRALQASEQIRAACLLDGPAALVGISMGGLEALLANREALRSGMASRVAALDPVLAPDRVAGHLDSFWHSMSTDVVQDLFRRIFTERYQEPGSPSFRRIMDRTRREFARGNALTDLDRDAPSAWICSEPPEGYAVFLSETDPVLGQDQRELVSPCPFRFLPAGEPGHTPLACAPELFERMIEFVAGPAPQAATPGARPRSLPRRPRARRRPGRRSRKPSL
jgi:hypothetical protein